MLTKWLTLRAMLRNLMEVLMIFKVTTISWYLLLKCNTISPPAKSSFIDILLASQNLLSSIIATFCFSESTCAKNQEYVGFFWSSVI